MALNRWYHPPVPQHVDVDDLAALLDSIGDHLGSIGNTLTNIGRIACMSAEQLRSTEQTDDTWDSLGIFINWSHNTLLELVRRMDDTLRDFNLEFPPTFPSDPSCTSSRDTERNPG